MKLRRTLSVTSVLAAGLGVIALAAAPAASATPVGVNLNCTSGSAQLGCSVTWRSTDGRVTAIRWTLNGRDLTSADDQTSFRADCRPGNYYAVTVTVADSTGRASDAARVLCQR